MPDFLLILVGTALVNNFVLAQFLGLCPFMGVSNRLGSALGMACATTFVLTLSALCSWLTWHYLLVPLELGWLRTLTFILVIAAVVNFTELLMQKTSPLLYRVLGLYLPLITTNCAVLGVALLNAEAARGFTEALLQGFGAALGFALVLVLFAVLRERLQVSDLPGAFRGAPIALITAGMVSMAFMGFAGLA